MSLFALWLATQPPALILAIGMLLGAIAWAVAGVLARRLVRYDFKLRCVLGMHDDDYVQCMNAWHCWACGRRTPKAKALRISARRAGAVVADSPARVIPWYVHAVFFSTFAGAWYCAWSAIAGEWLP